MARMMFAPMFVRSGGSRALTDPWVATGMKKGVGMWPWGVRRVPARARASVACKVKGCGCGLGMGSVDGFSV